MKKFALTTSKTFLAHYLQQQQKRRKGGDEPTGLERPVVFLLSKTDTTITIGATNPNNHDTVELYQNGELISTGSVFEWGLTGLTAETAYSFTIRTSLGGVFSPMSFALIVTTDEAGSEPDPVIVTLAETFFFDDFDGVDESLTGRTGWVADGDLAKAALIKADNSYCRMTTRGNGGSPHGYQVTSGLDNDCIIEFDYNFTQRNEPISDPNTVFTDFSNRYFLAWEDASNHIWFSITIPFNRAEITAVVNGASTNLAYYPLTFPDQGLIKFILRDNKVTLYLDDNLVLPQKTHVSPNFDYPSIVLPANFTKSFGVRHGFYNTVFTDFVKVTDLSIISVDELESFYGRDQMGGRNISVSGTYDNTATVSQWVYRVINTNDDTVFIDWQIVEDMSVIENTWSFTPRIDTGGPLQLEVGWIGQDGLARVAHSNRFSVGIMVVYWGQSNASFMATGGGAVQQSNDDRIIYVYNSTTAHIGSSVETFINSMDNRGTSAFQIVAQGLARALAEKLQIPVCATAKGIGANAISTLKPGTAHWNDTLVPFVEKIGGEVEVWVWVQGEAEALSASPISSYIDDFGLLVNGFRQLGHDNADIYLRIVADDDSVATATTAQNDRANLMRSTLNSIPNLFNNVYVSSAMVGVTKRDALHITDSSNYDLAQRDGLSIAKHTYSATDIDGRGPMVTGASISGTTVTLTLDLNGCVSLSGNNATGYEVSDDDFTTLLPISSVNTAGNTIVIELASAPIGNLKVASYRGINYDDSSVIYGVTTDGYEIPVFPIIDPITVN